MTVLCLHPLSAPSLFYSCRPWRPNICLSNNFYSTWLVADWYLRHTHTQKKTHNTYVQATRRLLAGLVGGEGAAPSIMFSSCSNQLLFIYSKGVTVPWSEEVLSPLYSSPGFLSFFFLLFLNSTKLCVTSFPLPSPPVFTCLSHLWQVPLTIYLSMTFLPSLLRLPCLPLLYPYCSISM